MRETRADSWITISPDHGDAAGDYTIHIDVTENLTTETRKAEIVITCGATTITIKVEQKAEGEESEPEPEPEPDPTPDPSISKYVSKITFEPQTLSDYSEENNDFVRTIWNFEYDDQNRIVSYSILDRDGMGEEPEYGGYGDIDGKITWSADGKPFVKEFESEESTYVEDAVEATVLTASGAIAKCKFYEYSLDSFDLGECNYDKDGYLLNLKTMDSYDADYVQDSVGLVWTGGLLDREEHLTSMNDKHYVRYGGCYGTLPNTSMNIDINAILLGILSSYDDMDDDNILNRLAMFRMLGKSSSCYASVGNVSMDEVNELYRGHETPNVTVCITGTFVTHEWNPELTYNLNADGSVSTISQTVDVITYEYSYDKVVGNELIEPDYPEAGYHWTRENYTESQIATETETYKYTFEYK